jgi:hypothetical protein
MNGEFFEEQRMRKLEYKVSFTTPAFLGNAEQQTQWQRFVISNKYNVLGA